MENFALFIPIILILIFILVFAILGKKCLKTKGYTGAWYVTLIFSMTPLFWLLLGSVDSRNPSPMTKRASRNAVIIGLGMISFWFFSEYIRVNS